MTVSARVICDSVSPGGERLTTVEVEFHRFILPEINTHRCLVADTELWFDLPNNGKPRLYKMTIGEFYRKWHEGSLEHKVPAFKELNYDKLLNEAYYTAKEISQILGLGVSNIRKACREGKCTTKNPDKKRNEDFVVKGKDFKDYRNSIGRRNYTLRKRLKEMGIRMLNEDTNDICNTNVTDIWEVGKKRVYKLTAGQFEIKGTSDHPILTTSGWKELTDITTEDYVLTCGSGVQDKSDPLIHKKINGTWTTKWNRDNKDFILNKQGNKCAECGVENEPFDLHHKVPVHEAPDLAFDLDNVVAVCKNCHYKLHKTQGWQVSQKLIGKPTKVTSVVECGEEVVYDLSVKSNFHNFIANGIVVHNCFSRNYQSSRAVPVQKMIDQVRNSPAVPCHWGKNQAGMVADGECSNKVDLYAFGGMYEWSYTPDEAWRIAASCAAVAAQNFHTAGYHKQVVNRLLEPFMWTKGIITADQKGWDSFFKLRCHKDAQPEIQELACKIRDAMEESTPNNLKYGEWHLPYVVNMFANREEAKETGKYLSIEQAIKISVSCCAQVSYRSLDDSLEKAEKIYKMLNLPEGGVYPEDPPHFSPTEHVAKCVEAFGLSGNFNCKQFEQYRKSLELGLEWSLIND